ncbi:MAG: peptidoglycan-binding protein [Cyanobacteria bacterium P01_H01_bin.153]
MNPACLHFHQSRLCLRWRRSLLVGLAAAMLPLGLPAIADTATATRQLAQVPTRPTLRLGSTGSAVSEIQAMLSLLGYFSDPIDGQYQAPTEAAVKAFQTDAGIDNDGIAGPATWAKLLPTPSTEFTPPEVSETAMEGETTDTEEEADAPVELPTLRQGMTGPAVARVQETLKVRGFYQGTVDGIFGPGTEAAVMEFQESIQLATDGIVGPATWQALLQ